MKLITRDTDYALRAVCSIAKKKDSIVSVSSLVKELRVPQPFLRKTLQLLNREGILRSHKGKGGGFLLNRPKEKIFLLDLIKIFQGPFSLNQCYLKKLICPNIKVCPLRKRLERIEGFVLRELRKVRISDLIKKG
jgi:Rrf2 family protein